MPAGVTFHWKAHGAAGVAPETSTFIWSGWLHHAATSFCRNPDNLPPYHQARRVVYKRYVRVVVVVLIKKEKRRRRKTCSTGSLLPPFPNRYDQPGTRKSFIEALANVPLRGVFQLQNSIQTQIREQIDIATRNAIIVNPAYLDDEQLSREGQFAVLTEIFNSLVRNNEVREICSHFAPIFQGGHPIHLSVLGKTGTGKTITLLYLLHEFEHLCAERAIPFRRFHLDLCCPVPCFRALNNLACLIGASKYYKRGISLDDLMLSIEAQLQTETGYIVIFVDEADNIRTDADTFFKFLVKRLPQRIPGKLILLFVSNRLNWSDNLDPRIKSCLKMRELIFDPYDAQSLQTILSIRVEKALRADLIDEGVIGKIAACSSRNHGDARRAVDLLTHSAYLAEKRGSRITLDTVDHAGEEIERDKYLAMIRTSPKHLQAALFASLVGKQKGQALRSGDAYLSYDAFCRKGGLTPLTQRAFTDILSELDMYGFIRAPTVSRGRYGRTKEIHVSLAPAIIEQMKRLILSNFDLNPKEVTYA